MYNFIWINIYILGIFEKDDSSIFITAKYTGE